jgi:diaminopimelate epimerase
MTDLYRLSGAGNDFLALTEPPEDPPPERIRAWCRRGISLGADGVFVLRRRDAGRVEMTHYNADGGRAELCANGTRCAALLVFELGWADDSRVKETVTLLTDAGPVAARRAGPDEITVEAPPADGPPVATSLEVDGHPWAGYRVRIGVPYFVLVWDGELTTVPVAELGPPLRRHPELMPDGANVDFLRIPEGGPEDGPVELRVWERGVEAETLASGTGALAAALVAVHLGRRRFPVEIATAGGFTLVVDGEPNDGVPPRSWTLTGDARLLARVEVLAGAEADRDWNSSSR